MRSALATIADNLPSSMAYGLRRLLDAGYASKTHSYFLLAGPFGAYMVHSALGHGDMSVDAAQAYARLAQACGDLWAKVHTRSVDAYVCDGCRMLCMLCMLRLSRCHYAGTYGCVGMPMCTSTQ